VEPETENLMEIIHRLYQRHTDLWELEDIRRDRSANDKIRLTAADQVSVVNKKRNDLVEMIDRIIRCDLIAVENNA
jgi:predicted acetyltransferase